MTEIKDITSKFFPEEKEQDVEENWLQKAAKAKRAEKQQAVQEALTKTKPLTEGSNLDARTNDCIARLKADRQKLEQEVMANVDDESSDVVEDLDVDQLEASIGDVDDWSDSLLDDYRPEEDSLREDVHSVDMAKKLNDVMFNVVAQCYKAEDLSETAWQQIINQIEMTSHELGEEISNIVCRSKLSTNKDTKRDDREDRPNPIDVLTDFADGIDLD